MSQQIVKLKSIPFKFRNNKTKLLLWLLSVITSTQQNNIKKDLKLKMNRINKRHYLHII